MASGDTLAIFTALSASFPASNFPQPDDRNNHNCLDFDDTTSETCYFEFVLPEHYGGGGTTTQVYYMASIATSGTVQWEMQWERHADDAFDLDADGFATAQTVSDTTATVSGEISVPTITHTDGGQMDSVAVGESCRIAMARNPAGTDTVSGDAELIRVHIKET